MIVVLRLRLVRVRLVGRRRLVRGRDDADGIGRLLQLAQGLAAAAPAPDQVPQQEQEQQKQHHRRRGHGIERHRPAAKRQHKRCAQARPQRGERRGILLRGLVGFDGVRRDDDLRQRPGVGGHAPDMHRVGHDGHAVLGGAGDGEDIFALVERGVRAGDLHGLPVAGGAAEGNVLRLMGDVEDIVRHVRGEGRADLPVARGERGERRVGRCGVVRVRLADDGDGIALHGAARRGDGDGHGVRPDGEVVAGGGDLRTAVLRRSGQAQTRHIIGYGHAVLGRPGGKRRGELCVGAGKGREVRVGGQRRGDGRAPAGGACVNGHGVAVAAADIGDGDVTHRGRKAAPCGSAALDAEGEGHHLL